MTKGEKIYGLQKKREAVAERLSVKYGKLWVAAEVFLPQKIF